MTNDPHVPMNPINPIPGSQHQSAPAVREELTRQLPYPPGPHPVPLVSPVPAAPVAPHTKAEDEARYTLEYDENGVPIDTSRHYSK